jgi:MtN3 and saliva related transmembrane protein
MNEIIGYIGAFLSAITFMPQVWQAYKTKSVGDLSIYMILIVVLSTIIWLYYGIYGISTGNGPVIAANTIVLALSLVLLYFKLTFKKSS